jgi:hypothetical protein
MPVDDRMSDRTSGGSTTTQLTLPQILAVQLAPTSIVNSVVSAVAALLFP